MTYDTKVSSYVKDVLRTAITVIATFGAAIGDLVIIGSKVGVVLTGPTDMYGVAINHISVDFNPGTIWHTTQFDPGTMPTVLGTKLYIAAATGLLTNVVGTNVLAGIYWGTDGSVIKLQLV